jgi:uncharacterized protein
MDASRRQFLKRTLGTAAVCGSAQWSIASGTPAESITDTHVYIGHWPYQQLLSEDPQKLVAVLHRSGVNQAWTGSFDGLFYKDIASANGRLADTCSHVGKGLLIPFGAVNPTLPDWEDDIRRCHETFRMPGIRLHPNYHGYTLDDPRFVKLLELAASRGLIVQLVTGMESERHMLLNPHAQEVDLKPLAAAISALPRLKVVVASYHLTRRDESIQLLLENNHVYFDFARASDAEEIKQLVDKTSSERVVFGSGEPLHGVEAQESKLNGANLPLEICRKISNLNAARLYALERETNR